MANRHNPNSRSPSLTLNGDKVRELRKKKGKTIRDFAAACELSERTIIRAENSENIHLDTAQIIAANLDVQVIDLIEDDSDQPIINMMSMWLQEGGVPASVRSDMPSHPEYVYRLSGDWKGWNHFLDLNHDDPEYKEYYEAHLRMDRLEDRTFRLMSIVFKYQMEKLREKVESGEIDERVGLEIITCAMRQRSVC